MTLSNVRATLGLNATATLGSAGTSGSIQLGQANQTISLPLATSGYSMQAVFANAADSLTLNIKTNNPMSFTAWVAGAAQVETATAAGTVSAGGNASVVVTAAGMTGSPKTFAVPVATSDTPTLWAAKVRTALAADSAVSAMFTVSGATTAIILTRKPTHTFTVPGGTLGIYAANDTTLNIALATGTAAGITTAATSANTTAGVASDGVKLYDADQKDLDGNTVSITNVYGFQASLISAQGMIMDGTIDDLVNLSPGEKFTRSSESPLNIDPEQVFTADAASSLFITVFGE